MTIVDTGKGILVNHGGMDGDMIRTEMLDIEIYGETESHDCPSENWCSETPIWWGENSQSTIEEQTTYRKTCFNKIGTITPLHLMMGKQPIATTEIMIPIENPDGDSSFAGHVLYQRVNWHNFPTEKTYCGMTQTAITLNSGGSDIIPLVDFVDNTFTNVNDEAFAFLFTPPDNWITVRECGSFPCTGPWNTILSFSKTRYVNSDIFKSNTRDW
eukprot:scpid3686/ scgid29995/ 